MEPFPPLRDDSTSVDSKSFLNFFGVNTFFARVLLVSVLGLIFFCAIFAYLSMPPTDFPVGKSIVIPKGFSLRQAGLLLKEEHLIRSRVGFEFCAISLHENGGIHAGEYVFKEPLSLCAIAQRFVSGVTGVPATRVTFPEGLSKKDIARIASSELPQFNATYFLSDSTAREGYLFPETYFFAPDATEKDVIRVLKQEFDNKIQTLDEDIQASPYSRSDIVIMASILEKEGMTDEDRYLISGILWKRIAMKMPLQVDAPFLYSLGKTSAELTITDLKTNSPYNTYTNRGLPIGPIGNPGLAALHAAIFPKASSYLYYLSDKDGVMHYAKTFDEHKANKAKYLK